MSKFDLDKLVAKALLGKHKDVVRPEEKVKWFTKAPYLLYLFYNVANCKLNVARALKDRMKKESKYPKNIQRKQKAKILKRSIMMDYMVDDMHY
ncbi:unnamed protein product [Dovyalis caffra]|uniref:Uncharacterized protein n=1 Tax=Dovyalis caffra TaxID=77055 RepID=A0AAV1RE10_9ROSI|nr:unnamed protein product [Dovyalis caffra]